MNLRGRQSILRGKMVGRRGIEPRTSGLKVHHLPAGFVQKNAVFPLSLARGFCGFGPYFRDTLRGAFAVSGEL